MITKTLHYKMKKEVNTPEGEEVRYALNNGKYHKESIHIRNAYYAYEHLANIHMLRIT